MTDFVPYRVTQGIPWERLIVVRDRRTHRIVRPETAWARVKVSGISVMNINVEITSEGALMLTLTAEETKALPVGDLEFDVVGRTYKRQSLVYGSLTTYPGRLTGELITQPLARGLLKVSALDTVTSLEQETQVEIRFKTGEDYRSTYKWCDPQGDLIPIKDAYMQAKDSAGNVVLDIRWFPITPPEEQILALPGNQRGYLAPFEDVTMELHISDANTVPSGVYRYDIFVQELSDDWTPFTAGALVVEQSVSEKPT